MNERNIEARLESLEFTVNAVVGMVTEMRDDVKAINTKLDHIVSDVSTIVEQAKPAFDQLMASPILAMITGGVKRNGR